MENHLDNLRMSIDVGLTTIEILSNHLNEEVDQVALAMYRSILDLSDSIFVLNANHKMSNSSIMMRALIESYTGFIYLTEKKKLFKQRALSYQYHDYLERKYAFITQKKLKINEHVNFDQLIDNMNKLLNDKRFKSTKKDYRDTKKIVKNHKWYSLFNGPKSFMGLLDATDSETSMDSRALYKYLSLDAHGYTSLNSLHYENKRFYLKPLLELEERPFAKYAKVICVVSGLNLVRCRFPDLEYKYIETLESNGLFP
ncbi:DUF5677 domain-containing protein [Alkalicoccobacillus gibsonii]|uniref:DUF5677 domain-containing protein n=1 Tax=Alkalicoccobacillus gibsonii TaxID=79881 RepID=UPI0035169F85